MDVIVNIFKITKNKESKNNFSAFFMGADIFVLMTLARMRASVAVAALAGRQTRKDLAAKKRSVFTGPEDKMKMVCMSIYF